jgi:hypothetical protein
VHYPINISVMVPVFSADEAKILTEIFADVYDKLSSPNHYDVTSLGDAVKYITACIVRGNNYAEIGCNNENSEQMKQDLREMGFQVKTHHDERMTYIFVRW